MKNLKRIAARLLCLAMILPILSLFSGCSSTDYAPRYGIWESEDASIRIGFADSAAEDCYITVYGTRVGCSLENDRGSKELLFYALSDVPGICRESECFLVGETVSLNDTEWIIRIGGEEYMLMRAD